MTSPRTLALFAGALLLAGGCATRTPDPAVFSFALMGDQQYNPYEEVAFPQMLDAVSAEKIAFVVHVGDIKAGSDSPCTDALYELRRQEFNRSLHPFIFTPGDNDWVDCRRPSNGRADPLERLGKMREIFHNDARALGKTPLRLSRQSDVFASDPVLSRYRENAMWNRGGVVFATFNIQGSNDNLGFDAASDREHGERTRANIEWLRLAIAEATKDGMRGLAIFLQANPGFEEPAANVVKSGYAEFLGVFEREAQRLEKPVLFAHGDTHEFRVDRPYLSPLDKRPVANITRVETYGSPFMNWVRITIDPSRADQLFSIRSGEFKPPIISN